MSFWSRKTKQTANAVQKIGTAHPLDAQADGAPDSLEKLFERIDALSGENRAARDPQVERRLLAFRHLAGMKLIEKPAANVDYPAPDVERLPRGSNPPEVAPGDLTPGLVRAAILESGCLLVRGLFDQGQTARLREDI